MKRTRISKKTAIAQIMQSLRRIFKAIQQYSEEVLKEFGVTGPQLWLLKTLRHEKGNSVTELSRKMHLHVSTVSSILDRLERSGYIARKREDTDRRVVTVHLTDQGKQIAAKGPDPAQGKLIYGLQKFSHQEVMELHDALQKIVRLMEVEQVKVRFFFSEE
jgi:DNA-binding MarR family transcriptional regulator